MAESVSRKELLVKMSFEADTARASRAVQALETDARKLEASAGRANRALGGGGGGLSFGQAVGSLASGPIAAATAVGATMVTVANMTKAWQDLDNELLTSREKVLGFARAIPLIGDSIANMIGSVQNAVERLNDPEAARNVDRMRMRNPIEMAQGRARFEFDTRAGGLRREVAEAGFRAQAVGEFPTVGAGQALLRGAVGGVAGGLLGSVMEGIDPRLTEGMEGVQAARRNARAAELAAAASEREVELARPGARRATAQWRAASGEAEARMLAASQPFDHRMAGARAAFDAAGGGRLGGFAGLAGWVAPSSFGVKDTGSNLAVNEALLKEQRAEAQALVEIERLEAKITTNKERQLALAQRQHDVARAETALMRTRVQILDEQYGRAKAGERQFGTMDAVGQGAVLSTLRRFQKFGRENVTQGELDLLMGNELTRDFVGQRAEKDAADSPVLKEIRKITGQRMAADLKDERDKLKTEVDLKIQLDEEKFAKLIEEKMKNLNIRDLLGEIVKTQLEIRLRRPEADAARARVERGG